MREEKLNSSFAKLNITLNIMYEMIRYFSKLYTCLQFLYNRPVKFNLVKLLIKRFLIISLSLYLSLAVAKQLGRTCNNFQHEILALGYAHSVDPQLERPAHPATPKTFLLAGRDEKCYS